MATNLTVDTHEIESKILFQYKNAGRFISFIKSFINPAMTNIEGEFFQLESARSLDNATGENLKLWADLLDVNYQGLSDEQIRDQCYWNAAEKFGTGTMIEAVAFFTKWFRAKNVEITELGDGQVKLRVIDGIVRATTGIKKWPCFPAGLAEVKEISFAESDDVFVFDEDEDPKGSGYAIIDSRNALGDTIRQPWTWPASITDGRAVISLLYEFNPISLVENVRFNFVCDNDTAGNIESSFRSYLKTTGSVASDEGVGGFFSFKDKNGTEWGIFAVKERMNDADLMNWFDLGGGIGVVSVNCVKDNQVKCIMRVNGIAQPWSEALYGTGTEFPPFIQYNATAADKAIFEQNNQVLGKPGQPMSIVPGLTVRYSLTERPGVGGRFTLLA